MTPGHEDLAVVAREVHAALARIPAADTKDPALTALQLAARPRRKLRQTAAPSLHRSDRTFELAGLKVFAGAPCGRRQSCCPASPL